MLFRVLLALSALLLLVPPPTATAKEYIVKLKDRHGFTSDLLQLQHTHQLQILDSHPIGSLVLVEIPDADDASLISHLASLNNDADVAYVVENISLHMFDAPNDPLYSQQYALPKVGAEAAWSITRGSKNVVVAVIDTGVNWSHEDLQIWQNPGETGSDANGKDKATNGVDDDGNGLVDDFHGWNFRDNNNNPDDLTSTKNPGHGTHCAGIIGAVGNNGKGVSGIAPVVSVLPVRFLGADGSGDLMTAAKAIDYAVTMKADVISASWGAAVPREQMKPILDAIERAHKQNILFVVAAANDGKSNDSTEVYPANAGFPNVISVAASGPQDEKPTWSNYGQAKVDLAAPGLEILSTIPGNQYKKLSGTSMATPLVAGSAALLLAQALASNKIVKPAEVKSLLQSTGATVAIETACHCRIDVGAALGKLQNNAVVVVPNAGSLALKATQQFEGFGGTPPYTFASSKPEVASISKEGVLTAVAKGETTVTVTDSSGSNATSKTLYVDATPPAPPPGSCPFNPPQICDLFCKINPKLPFCKK
jgi:thermitase